VTVLRRWLLLQAYFWHQGGFVFYGAVVVPIGTRQLDSALLQGLITQRVTWWLNLLGLLAWGLAAWNLAARSRNGWPTARGRWLLGCRGACLLALWLLHDHLGGFIDRDEEILRDRDQFRLWHIVYLWISTLDWVLGCLSLVWWLRAWQQEDVAVPTASPAGNQPLAPD